MPLFVKKPVSVRRGAAYIDGVELASVFVNSRARLRITYKICSDWILDSLTRFQTEI